MLKDSVNWVLLDTRRRARGGETGNKKGKIVSGLT